jgi:hypothetical protein
VDTVVGAVLVTMSGFAGPPPQATAPTAVITTADRAPLFNSCLPTKSTTGVMNLFRSLSSAMLPPPRGTLTGVSKEANRSCMKTNA